MSENKFIKRLKGEQTTKSVLEIKNESAKTSFANMPQGTSNAINVYSDHRGNATAVLEGTDIWKLNTSQFVVVPNAFGDGRDFTSTYTVFGSSLWVNATYTFDQPKIFTGATQWTLKLCGHSLLSSLSSTIGFSLIIKFGNAVTITKSFSVSESAFEFCKEFIVDFSESEQTAIKVANGDTMTVQLLCADATASATIYNGMTTLVAQQRRVDSEAVASDLHTFEDLEVEVAQLREDLDDLEEYVDDTFVRLDGESIMTGPLKMRATSSFQCAIAPYWDGVGFYKLNSDNSVTLIASIETPDGFIPWVTNTYNIGSSVKKWKNLYLSGKAYVSVINNGYDIAVPVTNSADTLALKSEVDLAANSGRMITDQGVWYAKMYGATVAPSAENGTNYADFSQVDGQGNPIIVIYERQNGAWVQSETITPPAEYDGYVPITSKIWDITEQAGQQGGRILWNHQSKEFTPYPQIVSFEDIEVTGTSTVIMPQNPSVNQIVNKDYVDNALSGKADSATTLAGYGITDGANTDLSNLTATGANIANWSSNVTNCITEIPQDIKLELNNGTLTLKAGSKVYVPNGAGVFDEVTVASDITVSTAGGATKYMLFYNRTTGSVWFTELAYQNSGTTPSGDGFYYNTSTNKIVFLRSGVADPYEFSFPIGIVTSDSTKYTDINQVFNGFGYIGSTVFALPGVKGLIPDGRNADGTLKNIAFTINTILTTTLYNNYLDYNTLYYSISGGNPHLILDTELPYYIQANKVGRSGNAAIIGNFIYDKSTLKITSFTSKTAFHAVDYSDTEYIAHQAMPSSRYVDLTAPAHGGSLTAPADGWFVIRGWASSGAYVWLSNETNGLAQTAPTGNSTSVSYCSLPVKKGDVIQVGYYGGSLTMCRFIYANGAQ